MIVSHCQHHFSPSMPRPLSVYPIHFRPKFPVRFRFVKKRSWYQDLRIKAPWKCQTHRWVVMDVLFWGAIWAGEEKSCMTLAFGYLWAFGRVKLNYALGCIWGVIYQAFILFRILLFQTNQDFMVHVTGVCVRCLGCLNTWIHTTSFCIDSLLGKLKRFTWYTLGCPPSQ